MTFLWLNSKNMLGQRVSWWRLLGEPVPIGFPSWNRGWNHQRSFFQENRLKHSGSLEPTYKWGTFWVKLTDPSLSPAPPGISKQVYLLCWDDGLQQVGGAAFLSGVPGTEQKSYGDCYSRVGWQTCHLNKNIPAGLKLSSRNGAFSLHWHVWSMYRGSPFRSTLNTSYITGLVMCEVCTEAVHCVALWTRVTSQVWACVKYVPRQSIP